MLILDVKLKLYFIIYIIKNDFLAQIIRLEYGTNSIPVIYLLLLLI